MVLSFLKQLAAAGQTGGGKNSDGSQDSCDEKRSKKAQCKVELHLVDRKKIMDS